MTEVESEYSSARRIDTSKAHPARVYDWLLDGKDNYPVDEELGRKILALTPKVKQGAQDNRAFMRRATRWLSETAGVRQFLDIGTGIPTEPNLHQVAQGIDPTARVVYGDNDPIVLAHAEALLRGTPEGVTEYVDVDVREPEAIIRQARRILDFDQPIALTLISLMHFIPDHEGAHDHVRALMDTLPSGSYLVLSQLTSDLHADTMQAATRAYASHGLSLVNRSHAEIERFFTGLEIVDPGVVKVTRWHPELADGERRHNDQVPVYAGVGRKP